MFENHFKNIIKSSDKYLKEILTKGQYNKLIKTLPNDKSISNSDCVKIFSDNYLAIIKEKHQSKYKKSDKELDTFIESKNSNIKVIWGDCLNVLKKMKSESIHCMVTSPPYYNARDYSQWKDIDSYLNDMRMIIRETYRVLDNHRVWVFNVGDIFDNPNTKTKSVWGKTRLPLGAYFIKIFEEEGFTFVDDIIWDKGEVQSERHKSGSNPFPFYQYPMNCYEHILILHKHRHDLTRFPCPVCGSLKVNGNTQTEPGIQSWECKNLECFERSKSNRGKRFSLKTNLVQSKESKSGDHEIEDSFLKRWRRDISKFSPVIKINSKGKNILGHSAPFPTDIPEMAVRLFTYKGEKVLDPFAGSYTSPIVASKLGRIGIGIELNKKMYGEAIINRINNESSNLFDNDVNFDQFDLSKENPLNSQIK